MTHTHRKRCFKHKPKRCTVCGETSPVVVHHADGDRTNNKLENLIPLCRSCHRKVHKKSIYNEQISKLQRRLDRQESAKPNISTDQYDGVPSNAYITVKEVKEGYRYWYWQWREGNEFKNHYIGPTGENPDPSPATKTPVNSKISEWV